MGDPWYYPWKGEFLTPEELKMIDKELEEKLRKDEEKLRRDEERLRKDEEKLRKDEEKLKKAEVERLWEQEFITIEELKMVDKEMEERRKKDEAEIREVYKNLKMKGDYRKFLGVTRHATRKEINRSFKRRSLELHPDRNRHLPEKKRRMLEEEFKYLNEAHKYLLKNY